MNREEIYAKVTTFLVENMDCPEELVSASSHLVDDLEVDSLSVLELTVFTEEEFEVDIEQSFKQALNHDSDQEPTVGWLVDVLYNASPAAAA